jgi:putative membrane protein
MIEYETGSLWIFFGWTGSVLPTASCFALTSGIAAVILKVLEEKDYLQIHDTVTDNAAFGMYTTTLAFLLIFRTSKCYSRFWHCATSACTFRAQLLEAASSLVSFSLMSNASTEDVACFRRCIVSWISLVHAMALSHVADCNISHFPVIDYGTLDRKFRERVEQHSPRNRVDLVYMWINTLIMKSIKSGLLNVPPPILSRVFQEMEKAMVEYNQMLEVMTIPFPFPYAQTAMYLLLLCGLFTPLAMCSWTSHPIAAGLLSFIAMACLVSLELISGQLENPFGTDDNDLPCEEFQQKINESLMFLLTSDAIEAPVPAFSAPPRIEEFEKNRATNEAFGPFMQEAQTTVSQISAPVKAGFQ